MLYNKHSVLATLEVKVNKDLINIIRSYLTVSEYQVKRSCNLLIYDLKVSDYNKLDIICGYCLICNQLTGMYNEQYYYTIP